VINFPAQTTQTFYCCPQFLHTGANVVLRNIYGWFLLIHPASSWSNANNRYPKSVC